MVKLFVEGGGDNHALKTECRRAFTQLLERAGFKGRLPRIVACGSRRKAFDQFCTATAGGVAAEIAILLVDAEAPVTTSSPWIHVGQRPDDQWLMPVGVSDDHLHLMVQCMEAWLLTDRNALKTFFGDGFHENGLPPMTTNLESVDKRALFEHLKRATRETKAKGAYGKGRHSFKLLAMIDPTRLRNACPWAHRFFLGLDKMLDSTGG